MSLRTALAALLLSACALSAAAAPPALQRRQFFVEHASTAPALKGRTARLSVREVRLARGASRGVVLFVHGAGTPVAASFDLAYKDHSWMAYLARAGFDVFALDMTGYAASTRPPPMDDPCNIQQASQPRFVPATIPAVCPPSYKGYITTIESDWDDIAAVVEKLTALRKVKTVDLVAWSLGGPRVSGYAARHPERVGKLVLLAPAYKRAGLDATPADAGPDGRVNIQSKEDFITRLEGQVGCPAQYEQATAKAAWSAIIASDPKGASWSPKVRRQPQEGAGVGFNKATAARITAPVLMVSGVHDKQVNPADVRDLYEDLASPKKVFIDLGCSSHAAMWEKNHLLLFKASLDWLTTSKVEGTDKAALKLGY